MKHLPVTDASPVLRTDFSDPAAWDAIRDAIRRPSAEGFEAYVEFIDDRDFDGLTEPQLLAAIPEGFPHTFIVVVDQRAVSDDEHPALVVNLSGEPESDVGDAFRALPSEVQAIENNLSIGNMDFAEFAGAVDGGGVFRGF